MQTRAAGPQPTSALHRVRQTDQPSTPFMVVKSACYHPSAGLSPTPRLAYGCGIGLDFFNQDRRVRDSNGCRRGKLAAHPREASVAVLEWLAAVSGRRTSVMADAYTTSWGVLNDQVGARTEGRRGCSHRGPAGQERRRRRVDAIASELPPATRLQSLVWQVQRQRARDRDGRNPCERRDDPDRRQYRRQVLGCRGTEKAAQQLTLTPSCVATGGGVLDR
jgi:hypothetical protein